MKQILIILLLGLLFAGCSSDILRNDPEAQKAWKSDVLNRRGTWASRYAGLSRGSTFCSRLSRGMFSIGAGATIGGLAYASTKNKTAQRVRYGSILAAGGITLVLDALIPCIIGTVLERKMKVCKEKWYKEYKAIRGSSRLNTSLDFEDTSDPKLDPPSWVKESQKTIERRKEIQKTLEFKRLRNWRWVVIAWKHPNYYVYVKQDFIKNQKLLKHILKEIRLKIPKETISVNPVIYFFDDPEFTPKAGLPKDWHKLEFSHWFMTFENGSFHPAK